MKLLSKIGLLCLVIFSFSACKNNSSSEQIKDEGWNNIKNKGTLVVGLDDTFVPMGFRDEKNELTGFDVELAKEVAENLGVKVEFQPIEWSMKESELKNGTIDVIWNGYTINENREQKVSFSNPFLENKQVLVTLKQNNIQKFSDMKNQTLGAQSESSGSSLIENNPEVFLDIIKDNEPVYYESFVDAFLDLKASRIQGILIDSVFAEYYVNNDNDKDSFSIVEGEFPKENFAVGVRKDETSTVDAINSSFKDLYNNGKMQELCNKWFGEDRIIKQ